MARYRESKYLESLEKSVEVFDAIYDLVEEVRRKTSSASAHKVLDQIIRMSDKQKIEASNLINELGKKEKS